MSGHDYAGNVRRHEHDGVVWVDVRDPGATTLERLAQEYGLHPLHVRESVQRVQHNQVEREKGYLFLVMHFPILHSHTGKVSFGQLGVFLGKNYVITVHREPSIVLDGLFSRCKDKPADVGMRSSAYLLYVIIGGLLGSIEQLMEGIDVELDELESAVFENNTSDAERIGRLRRKIIRLRRLIGPKKILLQDLAEQIGPFAGKDMTRYYVGNVKTASKLWEEIEEAKETMEIYKDADFTTSTEQTNKLLAVLTLVFTFTIPVTVVGTLYGMNIPMPGAITAHTWMFLGRFTTLGVLLTLTLVLTLWMYVYFHRKKWL